MFNATIVLVLSVVVASPPITPLLIVDEGRAQEKCGGAPAGWDSSQPHREAPPWAVAADFERYLAGLSFQQTPIIDAISHGRIRFCTDAEQDVVLRALASVVVRPPTSPAPGSTLSIGAEKLLRALAGSALISELLATDPSTDEELARQQLAIEIVEDAIASQR